MVEIIARQTQKIEKKSDTGPKYRSPTNTIKIPAQHNNFASNFLPLYNDINPNMHEKIITARADPPSNNANSVTIFNIP